jgi:hypothetical protein
VLTFGGLLFSIAVLFLLLQEPDAHGRTPRSAVPAGGLLGIG